ncbi:MAG: XylR family transcriptional regulator [Planctomycetia bacterium]|nr:XylR family transcriptional regulator [Planctomycetia bacterium]
MKRQAVTGRKPRKTVPKIAVILESSHEVSRAMIRGIFRFIRIYGDWRIEIATGGPNDQTLPDNKFWHGHGVIGRIPNARVAQQIVAAQLPCVLIDPTEEYLDPCHALAHAPSVRCDSVQVGTMAAEYLMNLGFDHFAFVGRRDNINWSTARKDSYIKTLAASGFSCQVYSGPQSQEPLSSWQEQKILIRWLKKLGKPVAIFAANDQRARDVLEACANAGISVPYQVAVLGVNNDELVCQTTFPTLSSIALGAEQGGYAAAKMMYDLLNGTLDSNSARIVPFTPEEIVERGSTARAGISDPRLIKAVEFIRVNAGLNLSVEDVARHIGLTRQWTEKLFQAERSCSVYEEICRFRFRTIRSLVARTNMTFTEIASYCGFESHNHLRTLFKKEFGMTMSEYRAEKQANSPAFTSRELPGRPLPPSQ